MNVLIFNFEYPPLGGGGGVATKQIAEYLAKRHTVYVITTRYQGLPAYEQSHGVYVYRVPVLGRNSLPTASLLSLLTFVPPALWTGIALARKVSLSVINAQFVLPSGIPAALLSIMFNVPLVVSFIGGDIYDPSKGISPHRHFLLRFLIRFIVRRASLCTAISNDTKKRAQTLHGITKEIIVTPLGLEPKTVGEKTRQELGLIETPLLAISIGRLIPRKSYHILLQAWLALPATVGLIIVGDGPLKNDLHSWVKKNTLQDRVQFVGFVDETTKLQLLQVSDIYVSAAEHEGFGIVFLEAMQAGLPIVAINEGGQTDFLVSPDNAVLVPPHNPAAIADAMTRLMNSQMLRENQKMNNTIKVMQFYIAKTAQAFEDVLMKASRV